MINTKELNDIPFFFILSMGRSGSTLLEFLLDAHPNVNIPIESRFIIHLYYTYANETKWTKATKKRFIKDLYKDHKFATYWNVDKEKLEGEILATLENISFFELCRIITKNYVSFYDKNEIKIQGSKNPIYALLTDVLYSLNLESKFIHLVRNPLGVIASHKKLNKKNLTYFAYRWNLMNTKIEELKQKNPAQFITIKYENLIKNPEQTMKEVGHFLEIDYLPEQLKFNEKLNLIKSKIDPIDEKEKMLLFNSYLKNIIYPINGSHSDSWKEILTSKEQKQFNYITRDVSKKYNYNTSLPIGNFNLSYIFTRIIVKYRYLKLRFYYKFSLSLR